MKIVMTVSNPFKPDPRVYKEAKSLAKAGHEVYVIAWDREGRYPEEEKIEGFRVIRLGPKAEYGPLMALKLPLFYLKAFKVILKLKPDAIHTHDFDTAILGFIFKKLKGIKWVYDVHDLYESFVKHRFSKIIISKIDAFFISNSNVLLVVNKGFIKLFSSLRRAPGMFVVMNTVPKKECERKTNQKWDDLTVFYGGVLSKGRFILEMIELCSKLGIKLRIAGGGVLKPEIRRKCINNCQFLGYIPHKKALDELSRAHLTFILYDPSILNNRLATPNKLFEAMAKGTPVLVVKDSIASDIVEDSKCGVSCGYSISDVKKILVDLRDSPKLIRKMGHNGKKVFVLKYSWDRFEEILKKVYGEVL